MPELPEVETIKRQLHEGLKGRTLQDVSILQTGRETPLGEHFIKLVKGLTLEGVKRRAKVLIFQFDNGSAILGHLKMTGKFLFVNDEYVPNKHDRILFVFTDGTRMMWSDIRKFGYVKFVDPEGLFKEMSKFGPEPLETPLVELSERLILPKTRKVKVALLDQSMITGVGNIYADEACFRAGIRPTRRLGTLSKEERLRLVGEVVSVLNESIAQKGTSANDYVDTKGEKGGFLSLLKVYGREGLPCLVCKTPIKKFFLAQRGTHYCVECQI